MASHTEFFRTPGQVFKPHANGTVWGKPGRLGSLYETRVSVLLAAEGGSELL